MNTGSIPKNHLLVSKNEPHFLTYTQIIVELAYPFMSIFILKFDQPQIFEKKPYKNYYFLVSYACVEPFL